ncbi:MAG: DMT family transporter [Dethiobacter sp.]|nr:DMT family transporter [Dethiobacter sp.]
MNSVLFALIIAAVAGIAMAVQGSLNAVLSKFIGLAETTFVVHLIGTLIVVGALFIFRISSENLIHWKEAPWYVYLGGALGVLIIFVVAFALPRAGVAKATTAIIIGQVTMAMLIDHFGLFGIEKAPVSWWKGLGLAFLAAGGYFMLRK